MQKLVNPIGKKDFFKDDALVRQAIEKKDVFQIPVEVFLEKKLVERAKLISQTKAFLKKCLKLNAKFVFTLKPRSELEQKSDRELIAVGIACFGLTREQAAKAVAEGKTIGGKK